MQCCPICLSPVLLEEEAFLQPCWHRFHFHCIQRWSEIQHRHSTTEIAVNSRSGGLKCPMCRQPYEAIMFDCIDKAFRFAWVDPQRAASQPPPVGYTMQLTPQQRRRRSVYFRSNRQQQQQQQAQQAQQAQQQAQQQQQPPHQQPQPHQQQQHHQQQQVYSEGQRRGMSYMDGHAREYVGVAPAPAAAAAAAGAGGSQHKISGDIRQRTPTAARAASCAPRKQPRRLDDPVTRQWLERELQALVLEEDVSLLLAAAWGSLLAACREQRQQQQQQQYKPYKAQATPCPGQPEHQPHMAKAAGPLPAHTAASQGPWPGLAMTAAATKSIPQQTKSAPSAHTPSGKAARPILRGPALAMPCRPQTANRPASAARQGAPALPPRSTPVAPETYDLDAASNDAPALSPCSALVPPETHAPVPPESSAIQPCHAPVQQHSPCSAPVPPEMHASNTAELPGSCCLRSGSQGLQVAETQATWFTSMEPPVQTHETQATDAESLQSHQLTSSQGAAQSHEGEGSHSSWQRRLSEAVQPFLEPAHAQQLPQELEAFLASGLSMQAYDQQMFQPQLEQQYEQEQEQEQGSTARVSGSREAGEHEAGGVKRRRGNDLSGHCPEVIEVFDDEEDGCHRPSTPISISSSSDSD
ncbi:hypothetical protein DUNSADRAFT_4405 [Dunaliella salina]|uniref:RING-type domain-containing protein n=1 Tax=Dunaliella salina TaxID=3046 RepID=A0ABQ7GS36_DUNSA|nr:hypothetical protein DUNSADRAFT_4405 [Dunaliella salina]|eukprot:KAF5837425.1 hypothetical protein DUNSADRAFT_4405 [Dunaliella salina]